MSKNEKILSIDELLESDFEIKDEQYIPEPLGCAIVTYSWVIITS